MNTKGTHPHHGQHPAMGKAFGIEDVTLTIQQGAAQDLTQANAIAGLDLDLVLNGDKNKAQFQNAVFDIDIRGFQFNEATQTIDQSTLDAVVTVRTKHGTFELEDVDIKVTQAATQDLVQANAILGVGVDATVNGDKNKIQLQNATFDVDVFAVQGNTADQSVTQSTLGSDWLLA